MFNNQYRNTPNPFTADLSYADALVEFKQNKKWQRTTHARSRSAKIVTSANLINGTPTLLVQQFPYEYEELSLFFTILNWCHCYNQ